MNKLLKDKWAVKAIEYLVRKDYSTQEVIEAMIEYGIKRGKIKEEDAPTR
jgi:hypothetical protein